MSAEVRWNLWFPDYRIPWVTAQLAVLTALVMALAYSQHHSAVILSRQGSGVLAGMWLRLIQVGAVTHELEWDRESAIGGNGTPTTLAAAFVGTLSPSLKLASLRDPECYGAAGRIHQPHCRWGTGRDEAAMWMWKAIAANTQCSVDLACPP